MELLVQVTFKSVDRYRVQLGVFHQLLQVVQGNVERKEDRR